MSANTQIRYEAPINTRTENKRILMLTWEYPPYVVGGLGNHTGGLVSAMRGLPDLHTLGHLDVLTTRTGGGRPVEEIDENVTIHRIDMPLFSPRDMYNSVIAGNDALIGYANRLAEQQGFDLIHVHDWLSAVAGVALKYEWKQPLVATIHATERGRHQGHIPSDTSDQIDSLEARLVHEAWRVIVCSQHMISELNNLFGTPFDKMSVIPNGIKCADLSYLDAADRIALRQKFAPNGERLLFHIGRMVHEKGLHVLVRAMPAILEHSPNTRLLVAGSNSRKFYPLAYELGIQHAVYFLDYITDKERDHLYQIVDAAIFPSLYEPFGIVALEAMALGCNVIVSDVGGLGEVVKHLQNGLTVFPNDSESVAWAVRELFNDPEAAYTRRRLAANQVEHLYDWQNIARQTCALYTDVIEHRRRTDW